MDEQSSQHRGIRHALRGVARYGDLCNVSFDLSPAGWQASRQVIAEHCAALVRSGNLTSEQPRRGLAHALVGTPPEIVRRLLGYRQAGVPLAWVFLLFPDLPGLRSLRLFAEEVLPAYRAAVP